MSKTAEQKIKQYRKKRIWPTIIFFVVTSAIVISIVVTSSTTLLAILAELKFDSLQDDAIIYETMIQSALEHGQTYQEIMDGYSENPSMPDAMCVVDKDDNVIASYGDQTILLDDKITLVLMDVYEVYADRNADYIERGAETVTIDPVRLFRSIGDNVVGVVAIEVDDVEGSMPLDENVRFVPQKLYGDTKAVDLAVWIPTETDSNGNRTLVKSHIIFLVGELFMILGILGAMAILLSVLLLIQLINSLVQIKHQHFLSNALFMDSVTGGRNWLYFQNQGLKCLKKGGNKAKTYAVVDFTLMKYRSYCSLHGVKEGELLLERLCNYLNGAIKKGEICARYGKASFALLLDVNSKDTEYTELQERLYKLMQGATTRIAHRHDGKSAGQQSEIECGTMIFHAGVAVIPPEKNEADKFVKRKNVDLLRVYNNAGIARGTIGEDENNQVIFFNHQMWEEQIWEHKVEENMQEALDNEEFQVYVQPKFNPVTEKLAGAEALVRWVSPTEGFISPGRFIPIFEKTGFVTKLDDYMISHVAKLQAQWLAEGKAVVPVSVNVSRAHFAQPDLAEHIRDLVDAYQVPHEYIEIELTESAFFDDRQALLTTVRRLQDYGFDVSMDDFGSGYSSLNSLKDLPLNVLKLDADFFRGEDTEHRGEIVVSRAIALAKQLNMKIVAEGVEKKEQVEFLAGQECDMIQGFYFAKPMPANEYEEYLKA